MTTNVARANAPSLLRNATDTTKLAASFTAPEVTENDDFWGSIDDERGELGELGGDGDDDADDAWGGMGDELDDGDDGMLGTSNTNTNGSTTPKPAAAGGSRHKPTPSTTSTIPSNDIDEPDFAGWLKAQQTSKIGTNKALPKGLGTTKMSTSTAKPSTSSMGAGPSSAPKATTGPAAVAARKAVAAPPAKAREAVNKPPEEEAGDGEDDAWGETWE